MASLAALVLSIGCAQKCPLSSTLRGKHHNHHKHGNSVRLSESEMLGCNNRIPDRSRAWQDWHPSHTGHAKRGHAPCMSQACEHNGVACFQGKSSLSNRHTADAHDWPPATRQSMPTRTEGVYQHVPAAQPYPVHATLCISCRHGSTTASYSTAASPAYSQKGSEANRGSLPTLTRGEPPFTVH